MTGTRSRVAGLIVAALMMGVVVSFAQQPSTSTLREPVGSRGLDSRDGSGESEEWLPPGVAEIDEVIAAKQRPTVTTAPRQPLVSEPVAPATGPLCPTPCAVGGFAVHDNASDVTPADPAGAAGDNHVVAAVNMSMGVWDRAGNMEVPPRLLESLFPATNADIFDPKVVYDQYNDTYVLVFLGYQGRNSHIFTVAIPDATADTPSTWCKRKIDGDQSDNGVVEYADYPGLGYDGKRVYITSNQFDGYDRYHGAQILAIPRKGLYDCGSRLTVRAWSGSQTNSPSGKRASSIQPATTGGDVKPSAQYMTAFEYGCSLATCKGDTVLLYRVKKTTSGLKLAKAAVDVPTAFVPYFGTQEGAPDPNNLNYQWDTGDLRLTNAFYDPALDRVYTAHAVDYNFGTSTYPEASARWYEIDPAANLGASSYSRVGTVGQEYLDLGWPAVATDADGTLFMTVSGAGMYLDQYLSVYATTIQPSTSANDALVQVRAGTGTYNWDGRPERWGDYNMINRDPVDGSMMWTFNQTGVGWNMFQQYADRITDA